MFNTADMSIAEYCRRLGVREPVPGGGSVNGVCGALACSLAQMVIEYSVDKKKFAFARKKLQTAKRRFIVLRRRFISLSDKDIESYGAYAAGTGNMKSAVKKMIHTPQKMSDLAEEALVILKSLKGRTNQYLDTDLEIAGKLFVMVSVTSMMNVKTNTKVLENL